ncbi:MAG: hypothetical protein ABI321_11765 [Polyangia bacterium]
MSRLIERVTLGLFAAVAGGYAVLALLIPQRLARAVFGHALAPGAVLLHSMMGGMQLGLALVALVCARSPKPPRTLVRAIAAGLVFTVAGPLFGTAMQQIPVPELQSYSPLLGFEALVALTLVATQLARRVQVLTP